MNEKQETVNGTGVNVNENPEPQPQRTRKASSRGKVNKEGRGYITVVCSRPDGKLNVRSTPERSSDPKSNIIGELAHGTRRQVLGVQDGWVKVKEGWIMGEFVK